MTKLLTRAATAAVLLFVLFMESPEPAHGQGVGVYRGRQGRRVGRINLPTPPFNPNAGILDRPGARAHESAKTARRSSTRRRVKAASHGSPRKRKMRRRVYPRPCTPRGTDGTHRC